MKVDLLQKLKDRNIRILEDYSNFTRACKVAYWQHSLTRLRLEMSQVIKMLLHRENIPHLQLHLESQVI